MTELLRTVGLWLYRLVPKADHVVLWGWPDHEDSILALEPALQSTGVRRVYLLMTDPDSSPPITYGPRTRPLAKASVRGFVAFLTARHVFFTHRCYMRRFPRDVVSVNVWHGMPVKRIGHLLEGDDGIASRFAVATSASWAEVVTAAMRPTDGTLTTGLPRNDRLFVDRARVWERAGLAGRDDVERLAVWLPTYRRAVRGMRTVDGRGTDSPFAMDDVDPLAMDEAMAALGIHLVVKPHPLARTHDVATRGHLSIVDDAWLTDRGLSLYELVGAADVLVSDFSSVVIDYLVLDRPVVHAIADLDAYRESRGFSMEPVEDLFAGPVATTAAAVVAELAAVARGEDPAADRRRRVRDRCHDHPDAGSTRRLLAAVGLTGSPT